MHIRLARAEAHFERGRRLHTCLARLALEHLPLGLVVYCGLQRSVPLQRLVLLQNCLCVAHCYAGEARGQLSVRFPLGSCRTEAGVALQKDAVNALRPFQ
jgi:hypothetical protein